MIIILVEGRSEEQVIPVIISREVGQGMAVRCINMSGKAGIVRKGRGFEDTIRRHCALGGRTFVVLMDAAGSFPPYGALDQEREDMVRRAQALADDLHIQVHVHWAILEIESWLVGGIEPRANYCGLIRVGRHLPGNTEINPAHPKEWVQTHLGTDYSPRSASCLAQHIDLGQAQRRNGSLATFLHCIAALANQVD